MPQRPQNLLEELLLCPHDGQAIMSADGPLFFRVAATKSAPQPLQNFTLSLFTVEQLEQCFAMPFPPKVGRLPDALTQTTRNSSAAISYC